jgi:hypothetical protein
MESLFRFHTRPDKKVRATIVGKHEGGVLKIASSRQSEKDSFNRKKGNMIAEGRLAKGKLTAEIPMEECTGRDFLRIAEEIGNQVCEEKTVVTGRIYAKRK